MFAILESWCVLNKAMYLMFKLNSKIEEVKFNWDIQFEETFCVVLGGMWCLILHVRDEEWLDMMMHLDKDLLEKVYCLSLYGDDELE